MLLLCWAPKIRRVLVDKPKTNAGEDGQDTQQGGNRCAQADIPSLCASVSRHLLLSRPLCSRAWFPWFVRGVALAVTKTRRQAPNIILAYEFSFPEEAMLRDVLQSYQAFL